MALLTSWLVVGVPLAVVGLVLSIVDCVSRANGDQAQVQQCADEFQYDLSN